MIKECTKEVMQNAIPHQPLTIAQPVPEQSAIVPSQIPSVLLFSMMPCGREYPFGQSGSAVLVASSPSSSCTSRLLTGRAAREAEKSFVLMQVLLSNNQNIGVSSNFCSP